MIKLPLKRKWFDMTKSGIKTEDYREISEYWFKRLVKDYKETFQYCTGRDWDTCQYRQAHIDTIAQTRSSMVKFNDYTENVITLGYPKSDERILRLPHTGIEIRTGNPKWGAEPNKLYFVIKHSCSITI